MKILQNLEPLDHYLNDPSYRSLFPRSVDRYGQMAVYESEETIIFQGEGPLYLYYLFSGSCKVSAYMENGKEIVIKKAEAPCILGEIELFSEDSSFSVEALSECLLLRFPLSQCREILLKDRNFLLQNCIRLSEKERATAFELSRSMSFPLVNRLAAFILDNSYGDAMNIRKTVIAESLAVSYRHLEKVMSDLVQERVLEKNGKRYTITDRKRLEELAAQLKIF